MALIDDVRDICRALAPHGWQRLLAAHGLDITRDDLAEALAEPLDVDRDVPGFRDFAAEGLRGITPGIPAHSLLYHALASPHVLSDGQGAPLGAFPTLAQIETVENYVYAAAGLTLADVLSSVGGMPHFAIAVFALEYRTKPETPHRRHADLCFARTGVARVGNTEALYVPAARGYVSFAGGDDPATIRVRPARYAPFLAVQLRGDEASFGPARFNLGRATRQSPRRDSEIDFWVPLHKLFEGPECLVDRDLTLQFEMLHSNEKLRRIHQVSMGRAAFDSGHSGSELDLEPFRFHQRLAERSARPEDGACTVVPIPQALVEEAREAQGSRAAVNVPPNDGRNGFSPSFLIAAEGRARKAPEYVHVRDRIRANDTLRHLNEERRVTEHVDAGGYPAQHYHDFTGDGWIQVECAEIAARVPRSVPAYSLVAAPDFFPLVGQGELMDWWLSSAQSAFRFSIWWQAFPFSLSDQRTPPNLALNETAPGTFRAEDVSVSAIVTHPLAAGQPGRQTVRSEPGRPARHSFLPDYASGVFAPGWDTSLSSDPGGTEHLAGYGLGSPFPEDAKLCAALSTYWPAAAPDSSRQYPPGWPLVCPLTDEEVGLGNLPSWDGNPGGRLVTRDSGERVVEYTRDEHVDYVASTLAGGLSLAATHRVTFEEYVARLLAMHRAYQAVGLVPPTIQADGTLTGREAWTRNRRQWGLISFRRVDASDPDVQAAANDGHPLAGMIFKLHLYRADGSFNHPDDFRKIHLRIGREEHVLVDPRPRVLVRDEHGTWVRETVV